MGEGAQRSSREGERLGKDGGRGSAWAPSGLKTPYTTSKRDFQRIHPDSTRGREEGEPSVWTGLK